MAQSSPRRVLWVERIQVASMLLVVLHHCLPHGYDGPRWLAALLGAVHHPALACFFLTSGLFAGRYRRYGWAGYLRRRFERLLIPYFAVNLLMLLPRYLAALALGVRARLTVGWFVLSFLDPHGQGIAPHLWFLPTLFIMGALLPALDALLRRGRGASLAALAALGILSALPMSAPTLLCLNELRLYLFWYFLGFARSEARGADCPVPGPLGLPVALAGLAAFALLMPRMDAPGAVFALTVCGAAALAGLCAALGERSTPVLRLFRGKTYAIYILSLCVQNLVEVVGVHGRWPWAVTALLMLITGLAAPLVIRRLVGALPGEKRATAFLKRVIGY